MHSKCTNIDSCIQFWNYLYVLASVISKIQNVQQKINPKIKDS